jgi:hypothetical protein
MLLRVAPVRADVLEKRIVSIIRVTGIWELGTRLAVTKTYILGGVLLLPVTVEVPSSPILVAQIM